MENASLVILRDTQSGDVYVAYADGETGEVITATRSLSCAEVASVFAFHANGGDVMNVTESAAEYMDCGDAEYLNGCCLRPTTLDALDAMQANILTEDEYPGREGQPVCRECVIAVHPDHVDAMVPFGSQEAECWSCAEMADEAAYLAERPGRVIWLKRQRLDTARRWGYNTCASSGLDTGRKLDKNARSETVMENASLVILRDTQSGDVYVAYADGETGEVITATRSLSCTEVASVFAFHANGGDVTNVTELAAEYMDCADAEYLNDRPLLLTTLDEERS